KYQVIPKISLEEPNECYKFPEFDLNETINLFVDGQKQQTGDYYENVSEGIHEFEIELLVKGNVKYSLKDPQTGSCIELNVPVNEKTFDRKKMQTKNFGFDAQVFADGNFLKFKILQPDNTEPVNLLFSCKEKRFLFSENFFEYYYKEIGFNDLISVKAHKSNFFDLRNIYAKNVNFENKTVEVLWNAKEDLNSCELKGYNYFNEIDFSQKLRNPQKAKPVFMNVTLNKEKFDANETALIKVHLFDDKNNSLAGKEVTLSSFNETQKKTTSEQGIAEFRFISSNSNNLIKFSAEPGIEYSKAEGWTIIETSSHDSFNNLIFLGIFFGIYLAGGKAYKKALEMIAS
ncbi:MAG: hypothetical protein Q7K42_02070, partial [Candidatus Diapherotrites archaeon]|nr:hypothetical protein [Candidatus Diapherotrites archaeon]